MIVGLAAARRARISMSWDFLCGKRFLLLHDFRQENRAFAKTGSGQTQS
jgi:hypothetical protein